MTSERKLSSPFMSKYEYAVVLGRRAEQIALGATPMVKLTAEDRDPLSIAKRELDVTMIDVFIFFYFFAFYLSANKKKTYRKESFLAQFGVFLEKRVISRSTCFFFRSCARLVLFCKKKKRSSNPHV